MEKTILIVEDDDKSYHLFETIFRNYNVKLIRANNGIEAVELSLKYQDIDLVLMDLKLPAISGFEATTIIKNQKPHIPIIAQTACVLPSDIERIKATEFDGFIAKPIHSDELFEKINRIVKIIKK